MNLKRILYFIVKAINIAITVFLALYCVFFGYIFYCNTIIKTDIPRLGPVSMYVVLSDSMVPAFKMNDAVFVMETDVNKLAVKDIIAFTAFEDQAPVTHRITKITESGGQLSFNTKGDNNNEEDSFVTSESSVLGKVVFMIPAVGTYVDNIQSNPFSIVIPLLLITLLQYGLGFLEKIFDPKKQPQSKPEG